MMLHLFLTTHLNLRIIVRQRRKIRQRARREVLAQVLGHLLERAKVAAVVGQRALVLLAEPLVHAQPVLCVVVPPRRRFEPDAHRRAEPHVVHHVLPDIRVLVHHVDGVRFERGFGAHARDEEELWGLERARCEDDFVGGEEGEWHARVFGDYADGVFVVVEEDF